MVIVQFVAKYGKYNVDERVNVPEHIAAQWCGEVNPRFRVAVRLPEEEAKGYFEPPANKMVDMADTIKGDDEMRSLGPVVLQKDQDKAPRGPGRPRRES